MRRIVVVVLSTCLLSGAGAARGEGLKLDAGLGAVLRGAPRAAAPVGRAAARPASVAAGRTERLGCLIRGRVSKAELEAMGIQAGTQAGGVVTAVMTWDDIARVSALPGVELIQLARPARLALDASRPAIQADLVQGGTPPNYTGITGKGVVVGICDTGIDWNHADFKDKNGLNRILYIWDQNGVGPSPSEFAYGTEWSAAQIQAGSCTEYDDDGHGTHVAGTAAGSGRATGNGKANYRYVGIAPEADIVFVKLEASFSFNYIIDGVDYIFQKAAALGEPAVVNLSLGMDFGPHDGTEANELALDALSGPGKIVSVAAGNAGGDSIHAEVTVPQGGNAVATFSIPSYSPLFGANNDVVEIDAYYQQGDTISVKLTAPNAVSSSTIAHRGYGSQELSTQGHVYVDNGSGVANPGVDGKYELYVAMYDSLSSRPPAAGVWTVTLTGQHIHSGGHVDLWLANGYLGGGSPRVPWRTGVTLTKEISTPSTAESVLCVAAFSTKTTWHTPSGSGYVYSGSPTLGDIASFSAHGPTVDGRTCPNIAAPGFGVAAARSSYIGVDSYTVEDSVHMMDQGTSMACPHVVGVTALILQGHPLAPPCRVRAAIESTATQDAFTGTTPNNTWGYGKLNALAVSSTTPVELYALDGVEVAEGFQLSWAVAENARFDRFRVLRSLQAAGPWTDLTADPLPGSARSYVDRPEVGTWFYKVAGTRLGITQTLGPFRAEITGTAHLTLSLRMPVPNPFRTGTLLSFVLPGPRSSAVDLTVYDVSGRRVATLYSGIAQPGRHDATWDGRRANGAPAGAGLYFVKLRTDVGTRTRKVALSR